jgi:hypothetical protein
MTADRSGDEPGLGGQSDDLSPMISSVQTRAIADARGAYIAGNLDALIDAMSDQQKIDFKIGVITRAYPFMQTLLEASPIVTEVPILYDLAAQIQRWLPNLREANFTVLREGLSTLSYNLGEDEVEEEDDPGFAWQDFKLGALIEMVASLHEELSAARIGRAATLLYPFAGSTASFALDIVERQWQVDLAWALLAGVQRPTAPVIDETVVRLSSQELQRWYERANVEVLTAAMSADRRQQFWHAALSLMLLHLEHLQFPPVWQPLMRTWLGRFAQRLTDSSLRSPLDYYALTKALSDLKSGNDYSVRAVGVAGQSLYILSAPDRMLSHNGGFGLLSAARAIGYTFAARAASDTDEIAERVTGTVQRWHLEAAWAILHDHPLPPLTVEP